MMHAAHSTVKRLTCETANFPTSEHNFKHHLWEPEVEVILSVIVSFIMLYIDVGIEATACTHSADTIG